MGLALTTHGVVVLVKCCRRPRQRHQHFIFPAPSEVVACVGSLAIAVGRVHCACFADVGDGGLVLVSLLSGPLGAPAFGAFVRGEAALDLHVAIWAFDILSGLVAGLPFAGQDGR